MQIEAVLRSKPPRLITVGMTSTLMAAARLLRSENIGALVVKDSCMTEGDVVLGMISERDVVRAVVERGAAALALPVSAFMDRAFFSCQSDDTVDEVCALMSKHHVRHMPVLHGEALIGVISIRDLLVLATVAHAADAAASGDTPFGQVPAVGQPSRPRHLN